MAQLKQHHTPTLKPSFEGFSVGANSNPTMRITHVLGFIILMTPVHSAMAQDNYEIQVYGAQTVAKDATMVELHSNYTFGGQQYVQDGVLPTHNMLHETIEITHGFTDWFETGCYFFNAIGSDNRTTYVGSHISPRAMISENWHWPVGVSLSL